MELNTPLLNSSEFTWKGNAACTEVSSLPKRFLGRVYDDACDEGFTIVSGKTGKAIRFSMNSHHYIGGDLCWMKFKPTSEAVRKNPEVKNIVITVFNH